MKLCLSLIVVILVGAQALTDEQKQALRRVAQTCQEQSGVTQEQITKARAGEVSDDPKFKKHSLCVGKRLGLANDNGEINVEALAEKLKRFTASDAEALELAKKCSAKKDTPEETTYQTFKCLKANKPNFVVLN